MDLKHSLYTYIVNASNPLFKKAIQHSKANDIGIEEEDDYNDYQRFMDFRNLRESLKTENYMHYYITIYFLIAFIKSSENVSTY